MAMEQVGMEEQLVTAQHPMEPVQVGFLLPLEAAGPWALPGQEYFLTGSLHLEVRLLLTLWLIDQTARISSQLKMPLRVI